MREGVRTARETARPEHLFGVAVPLQPAARFHFEAGVIVVFELGSEGEDEVLPQLDFVLHKSAEQILVQDRRENASAGAFPTTSWVKR